MGVYENQLLELDCENLGELRELLASKNSTADYFRKKVNLLLERAKKEFEENLKKKDFFESRRIYEETTKEIFRWKPFLWNLNIKGCHKLETLDIDCNSLEKNDFSNYPNLIRLSLMYNGYSKDRSRNNEVFRIARDASLTLSKNPELEYLNYYGSNYTEVEITDCPKLVKGGNITITENTKPEEFLGPDGTNTIVNNKSASAEVRAGQDDPTWGENLVRRQAEKQLDQIQGDVAPVDPENPVITDPTQLEGKNSFPNLKAMYGKQSEVNLAGGLSKNRALTGVMIIDDWQAEFIDVGNNFLHYLVVKNCPNLTKLIYSHNAMRHDAFIDWDSCPNLSPENVCKEKYNDPNWDTEMTEAFDKGELTGNDQFNEELDQHFQLNEQVKALLEKLIRGEPNAFTEFIKAFQGPDFESTFADLDEENQTQFTQTFVPKLEEKVKELISNFNKEKQSEFLKEVNSLKPFFAYLSEETKAKLTSLVKSLATEETSPNKKPWLWIGGLGIVFALFLGVFYLVIKRLLNYDGGKANNRQNFKKTNKTQAV